jgi:hypothetical protein
LYREEEQISYSLRFRPDGFGCEQETNGLETVCVIGFAAQSFCRFRPYGLAEIFNRFSIAATEEFICSFHMTLTFSRETAAWPLHQREAALRRRFPKTRRVYERGTTSAPVLCCSVVPNRAFH